MALQQKLSEVVHMNGIVENNTYVLEMEFKFVRYRLMLDDAEFVTRMRQILAEAEKAFAKKEPEKGPTMPKFYKRGA